MTHRLSVAVVMSVLLLAGGSASAQTPADKIAALRTKALAGDADAQNQLGSMYAAGTGVPKDPAQAVEWFRKAADQGLPQAQHNLGMRYAEGIGVGADDVEAYKWFQLAVSRSSGAAQKMSANERDLLAQEMTPERLAEAQQRTAEWLEAFAKRSKK